MKSLNAKLETANNELATKLAELKKVEDKVAKL